MAKKRRKARKRKSSGKRRRRSAPRRASAPRTVIVANPKRRRRRSKPKRRAARRRRNPSKLKFTDVLVIGAKAIVGGGIAYALDWGISYAPIDAMWQSVLFGASGIVLGIATAKWIDAPLGAGVVAGTGALLIGRVRAQIALSKMAKEKTKSGGATEGGAVRRMLEAGGRCNPGGNDKESSAARLTPPGWTQAGAVFDFKRNDAAAVFRAQVDKARALPHEAWPAGRGASLKGGNEAAASTYVRNGARYGPHNWVDAYKRRGEAGRIIRTVSAHNSHR